MRADKHVLLSEWIVIATFVVMVVSTFVQVICRYVLSFSLPAADELARICMVWLVFVGMVIAFVRGQQITVDLMLDRYRGRFRLIAMTLIDLAGAVLFGVLVYGGFKLMQLTGNQMTSGLGISKAVVYAALPLGAILILIEFALRITRRFSGIAPHPPPAAIGGP